jgi:hypothetical protein
MRLFLRAFIVAVFTLVSAASVSAQGGGSGGVGIGTLSPDSSAILELQSQSKGFLLPRMTQDQRDSISSPATGLMIYNTTDSVPQYYNGNCWLYFTQKDCDDCVFEATLADTGGTIDHTSSDSVTTTLTVTQKSGTAQSIGVNISGNLPAGVQVKYSNNPIFSSGTTDITFKATPFTQPGTYPIIIQSFCGGASENLVYTLKIDSCYEVDIVNTVQNLDLATEVYNQYPSAPSSMPICVLADIANGVIVRSSTPSDAALSTGSLPSGSVVGIVNNGNILGQGGDGGRAYAPSAGLSGDGEDGGDAIDLTAQTTIKNNGTIFAGGGGGAAMAFEYTFNLGVGNIGILVGAGGGGGAEQGEGGSSPGISIGFTQYDPGQDAGAGSGAQGGNGGNLNVSQPIPISFATVTLGATADGGDGGDFAQPGTQGTLTGNISVDVCVPIAGCTTVFSTSLGFSALGIPKPQPGQEGMAVDRNNNPLTNYPDQNYNTNFLKGAIGN